MSKHHHTVPTNGGPPVSPEIRVITHMNADHQDSLIRFLEAYHNLSSYEARHAHLTSMTLSAMTLSTSRQPPSPPPASKDQAGRKEDLTANTYVIPLDPPLTSWAQARERLVAMDKECLQKLDRSDITLKHYIFPQGFHLLLGILTCATFATINPFTRPYMQPREHSLLFGNLPIQWPGWFSFVYSIEPYVFWGMILVHGAEALYLDRTRLRRHSVPRGTALWWQWMVGAVLEGFGNFVRIDAWVAQEKKKREKQVH